MTREDTVSASCVRAQSALAHRWSLLTVPGQSAPRYPIGPPGAKRHGVRSRTAKASRRKRMGPGSDSGLGVEEVCWVGSLRGRRHGHLRLATETPLCATQPAHALGWLPLGCLPQRRRVRLEIPIASRRRLCLLWNRLNYNNRRIAHCASVRGVCTCGPRAARVLPSASERPSPSLPA